MEDMLDGVSHLGGVQMPAKAKAGGKGLMYKGRPMVRSGNMIYYGDMAEPFVAMLQLTDMKAFSDMTLPSKVTVQLLATDESLPPMERFKNKIVKPNLYEAINIAAIWLERSE
jgi:hypothetical protein